MNIEDLNTALDKARVKLNELEKARSDARSDAYGLPNNEAKWAKFLKLSSAYDKAYDRVEVLEQMLDEELGVEPEEELEETE